jgi:hypothetical protein
MVDLVPMVTERSQRIAHLCDRKMTCLPLPDFITSARREERVSPDFLVLTILNVLGGWLVRSFVGWLATEEEKFAQVKIRSSVERALTTRD